jgi:hypothetical protein
MVFVLPGVDIEGEERVEDGEEDVGVDGPGLGESERGGCAISNELDLERLASSVDILVKPSEKLHTFLH